MVIGLIVFLFLRYFKRSMCRLFACAHGISNLPLSAALDPAITDEFLSLSRVHRDGWGFSSLDPHGRSHYVSNRAALLDAPVFRASIDRPLSSCIIHERLASPGIDLVLDNQQPFYCGPFAFAHNGTISNEEGNIVLRPASYREDLGLHRSTTMSDSRLYADLLVSQLAARTDSQNGQRVVLGHAEFVQALSATLRLLRRDFPEASYNCLVQTEAFTAIIRAHAAEPVYSEGLRRIYEKEGWAQRLESYYVVRYASFPCSDGSISSVASSSGYSPSDSWRVLENNTILFISHHDASLRLLPLQE